MGLVSDESEAPSSVRFLMSDNVHIRRLQMPKFVIERNVPGAGQMTAAELHALSFKSNEVVTSMAPRVQWNHSYVTGDKLYCVYVADDAEAVREHATRGGFPADSVQEVGTIIDPTTGE
jgi:hypothetical protein